MTSHEALARGVALLPELRASLATLKMIQGSLGTYIENAEAKVKLDEQEPKLKAIIAALEASQPMLSGGDGMVMVPREPTEAMLDKAVQSSTCEWDQNTPDDYPYTFVKEIYRAMIAAAPAPASNGEAA